MSVVELMGRWAWREMERSPGRFTLAEPRPDVTAAELLGSEVETEEVPSISGGDVLVVARLEGGGLISYRRADGTWLHTLNTAGPFRRKLWELGIEALPLARGLGEAE